ncbi:Bug family tripartite tricarboxylate transporter substrate binding protein [Falsiroseomonas sp.]|uniref:Bug family tripartite tricarboxylate transporter substrate binding protein n=1 Tax=Falsiroseomonas sp. TaxID=2870721 RepID=UPI00356B513A
MKATRRGALAAAATAILARPAHAQAFPTRPLRLVVPFPPGGTTDIVGRQMATVMSETLGQPVVVENRPGASTAIGADAVARSAPDGHTMLIVSSTTLAINPVISRRLPYRPEQFAPVALLLRMPFVMVTAPSWPPTTVQEAVAWLRANPGKANLATHGRAGSAHLVGEMFAAAAKVEMEPVHYAGSAPATLDLVAGRAHVMFDGIPTAMANSRGGQVRALAVTGTRRSHIAPDLPTMAEAGLPEVEAYTWFGIAVPAETPPAAIARLHGAVMAGLRSEPLRSRFLADGLEPGEMSTAEFAAMVESEKARWRGVIEPLQLQID